MIAAASSTEKAPKMRNEFTNQAQQVSGKRIQLIPGARDLMVVVAKLIAPIAEPMQKMAMLTSHRSRPMPWPGPALAMALSGASCVQPEVGAPPGTKKAASMTAN